MSRLLLSSKADNTAVAQQHLSTHSPEHPSYDQHYSDTQLRWYASATILPYDTQHIFDGASSLQVTDATVQTTAFIIIMLCFYSAHMWWRPYESRAFFLAELASMACLLVTAALATLVQGAPGVPAALQDASPLIMVCINTATVLALTALYERLLIRAHCRKVRHRCGQLQRACCQNIFRRSLRSPLRAATAEEPQNCAADGSSVVFSTTAVLDRGTDVSTAVRRVVIAGNHSPALIQAGRDPGSHGLSAAYLAINRSKRAAAAAVRPGGHR